MPYGDSRCVRRRLAIRRTALVAQRAGESRAIRRAVARADDQARLAGRRQHRHAAARSRPTPQNPLLEDPFFRRFFDFAGHRAARARSSRAPAPASSSTRRTATSSPTTTSSRTPTKITVTLLDDRELTAEGRRQRRGLRRRGAQGPAGRTSTRCRSATRRGSRSATSSSRSAIRSASAHGHLRHRQRARPHRAQPGRLRGLHPDRRVDQSGQLRRRARQSARRARRHQHGDLFAHRRQHRHRLRDPVEHGRRPSWTQLIEYGEVQRGMLGVQLSNRHAGHRQEPRTWTATRRAPRVAGRRRIAPPTRPASRPAT